MMHLYLKCLKTYNFSGKKNLLVFDQADLTDGFMK